MSTTSAGPARQQPAVQPARRPGGEPRTRHHGSGHLAPLDGVRGIAILAVMTSHLFAVNYEGQPQLIRILGHTLYYGSLGVDLFFVLSGFLITGILVDSREGSGYFRNFYMRRILRIFPLYYGALLLLFALTPVLHLTWHGLQLPLLLYGQNLQRYSPFIEHIGGGVSINHLWSLAIEEQFYLLWPFVVFVARTRRRVLVTALTGSALALALRLDLWCVLHNGYQPKFNMFARADALLLGAVLAMLYRNATAWATVARWCRPVCLGAIALILFSIARDDLWPFHTTTWIFAVRSTFIAAACTGLLAWSLRPGIASRFFSLSLLRSFGKYSYGLYVLHMLFLPLLSGMLRPALLRWTGSKSAAVLATAAIILALSVLAAYLSFHLYEKRFLRLKRYFDYVPRV